MNFAHSLANIFRERSGRWPKLSHSFIQNGERHFLAQGKTFALKLAVNEIVPKIEKKFCGLHDSNPGIGESLIVVGLGQIVHQDKA